MEKEEAEKISYFYKAECDTAISLRVLIRWFFREANIETRNRFKRMNGMFHCACLINKWPIIFSV